MRKKNIIILSILLTIILVFTGVIIINSTKTKHTEPNDNNYGYVSGEFNLNLIKTVNKTNNANYLISPYSIEIALNMLKNGAKDKTYDEILNVIGERNINDITIKDRISVANAAFIKSEYQKYIKESYYNTLKDRYQSEILYDEFKTPKIINNWVNTKTNGMIKEILNDVNENFVLGLANALAIDVEWDNPFECNQTSSAKFTKIDNKTMQVEMMHNTLKYSGAKYLKSATATGIIIPYKKYASNGKEDYDNGENLEFVAILPNDNVNDYIDSLNNKVLNELYRTAKEVNDEFEIKVSLPRFRYDYELSDFKEVLKKLGIIQAFDPNNANFSNIMDKNSVIDNLYVGEAIHKTHIDLNEKGTKAAAITYFGMFKNTSIIMEKENIEIEFNRPFIYIIKDSKTNEMLFFGVVYEPNKWNGSTCSNEE